MEFKIIFDFSENNESHTILRINEILAMMPLTSMKIASSNGFLLRTYDKDTGKLESQNYEFRKITLLCSMNTSGSLHYFGIDTKIFPEDETPEAKEFIARWKNENSGREHNGFALINIPDAVNVYIVPYRGEIY